MKPTIWLVVLLLLAGCSRDAQSDADRATHRIAECRRVGLQPLIEFYGERTVVTGCALMAPVGGAK